MIRAPHLGHDSMDATGIRWLVLSVATFLLLLSGADLAVLFLSGSTGDVHWLPFARNAGLAAAAILLLYAWRRHVRTQFARRDQAAVGPADSEQTEQALRMLTQRTEKLQEAERKRLAVELHDQLGSDLTGLGIHLNIVRQLAAADTEMCRHLDSASDILASVSTGVHDIASSLRPAILDDFGLGAGIEFLVERLRKLGKHDVVLQSAGDDLPLSGAQVTALFRVCQESLTNICRHAGANRVDIRLQQDADYVRLAIDDNGCGMDIAAFENSERLGIIGMRERMASVGGTLDIHSEPGRGTSIQVTVPLSCAVPQE